MSGTAYIRVTVTDRKKIRAHIQEPNERTYSVIVGSPAWENGKGRKYEEIIKDRAFKMVNTVRNEYEKYFNNN